MLTSSILTVFIEAIAIICLNMREILGFRLSKGVFARHLSQSCNNYPSKVSIKQYSASYEIKHLLLDDYGKKCRVTYIDENPSGHPGPPLVIVGGTAQTINTYTMHIKPIAKSRRLVIIEMRGQGSTELQSQYATMRQHVSDLHSITDALGIQAMDLSGFSFGGRLAVAFAAHHPHKVSKLSVTGTPLHRPRLGGLVLRSWQEALERGNLRDCAWSFILNGYSADFIEKYADKLPALVDMVLEANKVDRLYDLVRFSGEGGLEYTVPHCAPLVQCPTQIIAAMEDRIAGYEPVLELQSVFKDVASVTTIKAGHLAPFEQPVAWRKALLTFLG
ncbi:alpha/beta hydrolase [archaeon]|nr:MAG: alpha/beta hydrolase [archaeon]